MDTYSLMREFADSWALLMLCLLFVGVVFWAWRPGSRKMHDDTANIPFRHDDRPEGPGPKGTTFKEAWK
ncbi:cbb3-type cytochrome c oxidase subunit 3 [Phaeovulum vinaykumarii]|uniref:Cytochrome c oxidase cbb3-type subunit 4 n=1 Tax=Phaeovulum vinaykumarii TaxID=407234 RepID=A0A1N7KSK6_9RHOB|nr:cbb3-type cytochrome c oxidase subunit 3 [Phaeovulum vinaykumarii]SIS64593.1 cytochrome c oxidase cbb3-type subunit 4 [Phaeovulum vinaykumarii]SOC01543.1 cytochrome c oxidase cbb3-type subunit 4 [Phaeovulum vinaykumarii]